MTGKYSFIRMDEIANDTYNDMVCKYRTTKAELAKEVREEFRNIGKEAVQLISSTKAFHPSNYQRSISKIISIDRYMNRKVLALGKIGIVI